MSGVNSTPIERRLRRDAVILSTFSAAHLGDVLCTSPLPRLLSEHRRCPVYVTDHPVTRAVFACNPYVAGFHSGSTLSLNAMQNGDGHILQRLMQGFELPIPAIPKPEIYLSPAELAWAREQRKAWAADRPMCVLSTAAVSDRENAERTDWAAVVEDLRGRYTVVQPVLSEAGLPGCVVCRGLSTRHYMALFAVADCFVGGTSSGSHLAAAFDVPAVVVVWRSLENAMRFPAVGPVTGSELFWKAAYLYPHHWFIAAEDISRPRLRRDVMHEILEEIALHGRSGRPNSIGNHAQRPCGFSARPPVRLTTLASGRIVRTPAVYGERARKSGSAGGA